MCALGSFRPELLPFPYWPQLSGLRSDTSGALAFVVAAICLITSEFPRLRRRAAGPPVASRRLADRPAALFTVAVAETVAVLGTGLVVYISANAITHLRTLLVATTHLVSSPTEGTLRMLGLIGCAASVAVLRYLLASSPLAQSGRRPVAVGRTGVPGGALPGRGGRGRLHRRVTGVSRPQDSRHGVRIDVRFAARRAQNRASSVTFSKVTNPRV